MTMRSLLPVVVLLICGVAHAADNAYVIDKLLVGVHENQDLDSAIIKVLPTGTELEVVKREGELALVKDKDGDSGWVDVAYLMADPPAQLTVEKLQADNKVLTAQLEQMAAQAAKTGNAAAASGEPVEILTKQNTELKGKLSAEKLKVGELQAEVAVLKTAAGSNARARDPRISGLEQVRSELEQELKSARREIDTLTASLASRGDLRALTSLVGDLPKFAYGIGTLLILLAFGAGVYLMDYVNRRRHGGFRV